MRYLVISDIHANLEAYETVMTASRDIGWDRAVVLGDLVGYGGDPNAVVDRVRELGPHALIRGNHDKVSCGLEAADGFNTVARMAAYWTVTALTDDNREWVAALPRGPVLVDADVQICHGSPRDEDEYIFGPADARGAFSAIERAVCLWLGLPPTRSGA